MSPEIYNAIINAILHGKNISNEVWSLPPRVIRDDITTTEIDMVDHRRSCEFWNGTDYGDDGNVFPFVKELTRSERNKILLRMISEATKKSLEAKADE